MEPTSTSADEWRGPACPRCGQAFQARIVTRDGARELHATLVPAPADAPAQAASLARAAARLPAQSGLDGARLVAATWFTREVALTALPRLDGGGSAAVDVVELAPCCDACRALLQVHFVAAEAPAALDLAPLDSLAALGAARGPATGNVLRLGGVTHVRIADLRGDARRGSAEAECRELFSRAFDLLDAAGVAPRDVVRTWIFLSDIDRDYAALNAARRDVFRERGVTRYPASTGIGGSPLGGASRSSLTLHAIAGSGVAGGSSGGTRHGGVDVATLHSATFNEAFDYGSFFSRGLRVVEGGLETLLVSGTAAIDDAGLSCGEGDLDAQAEQTLANLSGLVESRGARLGDSVQAVSYLKRRADAPRYVERLAAAGLGGVPHAIVEADVCRPELLCETELLVCAPRAAKGAAP